MRWCLVALVWALGAGVVVVSGGKVKIDHARISCVHKKTQAQEAYDAKEPMGTGLIAESLKVTERSKVSVTVGMERDGEPFFPHQAFLLVRRVRDDRELLLIAERKGTHMVVVVPVGDNKVESGSSPSDPLWMDDETYSFTLILGDWAMEEGAILWEICPAVTLFYDQTAPKPPASPGVFDFDLSTKKELLAEYSWEQPEPGKRAPVIVVLLFTILTAAPTVAFFAFGSRFGAFPLVLPSSGAQRGFVFAFGACLACYVGSLVLFWVKWSIFDTWKLMLVLLPPTIFTGHRVLADVAAR
mmetsp:Transcript_6809/g.14542  ORF Transcript_6809/g.14542 Transcript_6809/m.14542 type:complete len:299 (+) Transcript_6809:45-941(+)|eukprot:CAMPEP_0185856056 /NCGR_PEP_ID=MMETSP1354-20130828/27686_1 /TAXON_ID=708628 /ORGANISM="Erythrolobus madagascarensis, Strain CCMP3276" /LENGTH=298 /DNA_ID=CAMNT_0028558211 /DNA_START=38 /DNA_END=934 /DNA_ORIENTATION=-